HQSFHQGADRVQGKARPEDPQSPPGEGRQGRRVGRLSAAISASYQGSPREPLERRRPVPQPLRQLIQIELGRTAHEVVARTLRIHPARWILLFLAETKA